LDLCAIWPGWLDQYKVKTWELLPEMMELRTVFILANVVVEVCYQR